MAKALRTVGMVVAAVALVATGVGVAAGGAAAASTAGTAGAVAGASTAATALSIAQYAGLAAGALSVISAVAFKPKFGGSGSPTKFTTNPQSAIPYAIGRTRQSGVRIYAETWDAFKQKGEQDILGFGVLLSGGGQIDAIEKFTADNVQIDFNSTTGLATTLGYEDWMAQKVWLGGPQAAGLSMNFGGKPFVGWSTSHKLSGIAHAIWAMRFDTDGKHYGAGPPEPAWIGRWVRVYDPRLDSTYPGGSGACRPLQEETYVWSRNPALHALTWALGRWQNGKKTFGIGAPIENIRVGDFVEAANIADANKWYCGGIEYSTDSKWEVFKRMLQAGGSEPTMTGAMIGCRTYAPKVSVTVINGDELLDGLTFAATKPQRDRINTVVPRYRSEEHEWEVISGAPISVAEYVAADGRIRQKEYDLPLVQHEVGQANVDGHRQAGQLAAYEIVNAREAGPIQFTTGPKHIGLKAGDCVTLNIPTEGFDNTKILIVEPPKFDPSNGTITFLGQTETDSKHAFALGKTAVPPPPFSLTPPEVIPGTPTATDWSVSTTVNAQGIPTIVLSGGSPDGAYWENIVVEYKKTTDTFWTGAGQYRDGIGVRAEILAEGQTAYNVRLAFVGPAAVGEWLEFAPVTTPASQIAKNNTLVMLYRRTTTSATPSVVTTGSTTYNFSDGSVSGQPTGWTSYIPDVSGGNYLWVISKYVNGSDDTISFANTTWSSPVIYVLSATDGINGLTAYLTKEAINLFAYANGNVESYSGATGLFKVFSGNSDVSTSFSLSTVSNPQGLAVTYAGQTYTISGGLDNNEDSATLTIRATGTGLYAGITLDKIVSITKSKGGYEIVATLPTTNLFEGRVVLLTTDDKLYRYTGTAWTASVPATDITGELENSQLADGIISASKFAAAIEPVTLVASIPSIKSTSTVYNSTDGKLYRWSGTEYVASVPAGDITGQITETQITDGSVSTVKLAAEAITADKVAANAITADKVAANAITAGKIAAGAVSATQLAASAITAEKIAAGAVTAAKLLIGETANLLLNGDFRSGNLDGWVRKILTPAGSSIDVVGPDATGTWPSAYGLYFFRPLGATGEVSILNGNSSFSDTTMREGIDLAPNDEVWVEGTVWSTNTSTGLGVDCLIRNNSTTLVSATPTALQNTVLGGNILLCEAGPTVTKFTGIFKNTSGANGKAYLRFRHNGTAGTEVYAWNLKAVRRNKGELIVDGAVTADKVAANAITADKISAGAVTAAKVGTNEIIASSANIKDGVIATAKIGDAQITTAKIADLQVSTLKIADQAVTIPAGAYTAAALNSVANTWVTCQTATITSTGAPINVMASLVQIIQVYAGTDQIRITRNGVTIYSANLPYYATGYGDIHGGLWTTNIIDVPGSGVVTYNLDFYQSKTTTGAFTNRSITLMELKK